MIVVDGRRGGAISGTSALLGRRTELALIEQLIADPAPRPRGIALEGEAGIGKTILWQTGVEHAAAHGIPVLGTRGSEPAAERRALQLEATYWVHGRRAAQELVTPLLDDAATEPHLRAVALALAADVGDPHGTPRAELAQHAAGGQVGA